MQEILFFVLAAVAVGAAIAMLLNKNPVYSVLPLIVTLFSLAGLYVLLNASFIAAVHLIVYAGAIMVLFLFVLMLLDLKEDVERISLKRFSRIVAVLAVFILLAESIILVLSTVAGKGNVVGLGEGILGDVDSIAMLLFTRYILPFEIASVLLLVGIIGAVVLARRKPETGKA